MKKDNYPSVIFKVEIILYGDKKGNVKFCLGLNDVHSFVELERIRVGLKEYSGYRSQAIELSSHAERVIKSGLNTLNV